MHCPRVDHFVKIVPPVFGATKVFTLCCHMDKPPRFNSYDELMNSEWLKDVRVKFANDEFPKECNRCKQPEELNLHSVRHSAIETHKQQTKSDYLIADLVLDNICNGGCQFCTPYLSTKLGSLSSNDYFMFSNVDNYNNLPLDRIVQLDISGGEPSNSKNGKALLSNLPINVKKIRINTNASGFIDELVDVIDKGIEVEVTISFDGVGSVYEYVRWPVTWNKFLKTVEKYKQFKKEHPSLVSLNFWSTVNALNINDFENIIQFAKDNEVSHGFSLLSTPSQLSLSFQNELTMSAKEKLANSSDPNIQGILPMLASGPNNQQEFDTFVNAQDKLRGISISSYI